MDKARIVLLIELSLVFLSFGMMLCVRILRYWNDRRLNIRMGRLKQLFTNSIMRKEALQIGSIPRRLRRYDELLQTVESFDRYFRDPVWSETKHNLIEKFLLSRAKELLKSKVWQERQLGLRCIALNPQRLLDEALAAPLINDPIFLVRIFAASCMVRSMRQHLVLPVLKKMAKESPMARYPYRDFFVHSGSEVFLWLEKIAAEERDEEVLAICLDILSSKVNRNLVHLAIKYCKSSNLSLRLASIKLFVNSPSAESERYLAEALSDKSSEIRAEAAVGLGKFLSHGRIAKLCELLNDENWNVRLQSALTLKKIGKAGITALEDRSGKRSKEADEIAAYVLALP